MQEKKNLNKQFKKQKQKLQLKAGPCKTSLYKEKHVMTESDMILPGTKGACHSFFFFPELG